MKQHPSRRYRVTVAAETHEREISVELDRVGSLAVCSQRGE